MKKVINKMIYLFIIIFFSWIFISSQWLDSNVYYTQNRWITYLSMFLFIFIFYLIYYLINKIKNITDKQYYIFAVIYMIIVIIIQIFVDCNLGVELGWDSGVIYNNAVQFVYNGTRAGAVYTEYFELFPSNILLLVIEIITIKIGAIFGINSIVSCYVINTASISFGLLILSLYSRKKYGNKTGLFTMIVSFFFLPIFLYTPIIYSDTLTFFVPILILFLFDYIEFDKFNIKNIIIFILLGILMFYGKEIKITSLIIFISLAFCSLFKIKNIKSLLYYIIPVITFILLTIIFNTQIVNKKSLNLFETGTGKYPYSHWIMMGVEDIDKDNNGRNSYGGYNVTDYDLTYNHMKTGDASSFNMHEYVNRVRKMKFTGYINYLNKKAVNTWTDGYYFVDVKLGIQQLHKDEPIYQFIFLKNKKFFIYFVQGIQFVFIICLIIDSIVNFKNNSEIDYLKLTIIGLAIFFLLWENRSRYLYNYIPLFILQITILYDSIFKKMKGRKKNV